MELKDYLKYIKLLKENIEGDTLKIPTDFPQEILLDKTFVKLLFYYIRREYILPFLKEEMFNDEDFVLFLAKDSEDALKYLPLNVRDNKSLVLKVVQYNGYALKYASPRLQNDKDVAIAALNNTGYALDYVSKLLHDDRDVVLAAVSTKGRVLEYVNEQFCDDREVVMRAVLNYGCALEYASPRLKADRELVKLALAHPLIGDFECISPLRYASEELQQDPQMIAMAIKYSSAAITDIPDELFFDKEFILSLCKINPEIYEEERMVEYLFDREVVKTIATYGVNISFSLLPGLYYDDEEIVKLILKKSTRRSPLLIFKEEASSRLQSDPEMLLYVLGLEDRGGYRRRRSIDQDLKDIPSNGGDFDV